MVAEHDPGGVLPRDPHHAAAGVGPGTAQVEVLDRGPVVTVSGDRSEREQLVGAELALHDVAAEQPVPVLHVPGAQDLHVLHEVAQPGRVRLDPREHAVGVGLALGVPRSLAKLVRGVLGEPQHQVLARGREPPFLVCRGEHDLDVRMLGGAPVLAVVPRALEVLDRGRDRHQALVHLAVLIPRREDRQLGERDVHLDRA